MGHNGAVMESGFTGYDNPVAASRAAVDLAERHIDAGVPGLAAIGGPALYQERESILMDYGAVLAFATGCEIHDHNETFANVFSAVMDAERTIWMPDAPKTTFWDARMIVARYQQVCRDATPGNFYDNLFLAAGTTPEKWMRLAIENGLGWGLHQSPHTEEVLREEGLL